MLPISLNQLIVSLVSLPKITEHPEAHSVGCFLKNMSKKEIDFQSNRGCRREANLVLSVRFGKGVHIKKKKKKERHSQASFSLKHNNALDAVMCLATFGEGSQTPTS